MCPVAETQTCMTSPSRISHCITHIHTLRRQGCSYWNTFKWSNIYVLLLVGMHQQEHPIEYEIQFIGPPYKQVVDFNSHLWTKLNRNITYIFLMITDQPHYKSLSGEIQLALFYWTFPMNIFTSVVQHSCFSARTVVKEPWRITDHQCGSSITASVKTPFTSTQRWRYYPVTLLAPIGLWSLLLKNHNDHFINLSAVSLTHSWTQAVLHRHCPTVPNKLTLIVHSLTLHTDHHHFHSYFYSLWYKAPNIASLLPLTWPRWGRGHRWLVMIHLHSWKENDSTSIPIYGAGSHPQIEDHGLSIEGVKSQPSPVEDHGPMKPAEPQIQQKAVTQSWITHPPPLITSLCIENLSVMSRFSVNGQTRALTENESTHNQQCGPTHTEMPLKAKSMQLDTNNHQTSDWTNREICTVSHAPGEKFDYLH